MATVDLIGHSFIRNLETYCKGKGITHFNLDPHRFQNFNWRTVTEQGKNISRISRFEDIVRSYEDNLLDLPYYAFIEIGGNDIQNYINDSFRDPSGSDFDKFTGANMAARVLVGARRLLLAGVPVVLLGAAMPRTRRGHWGAAASLSPPHLQASEYEKWCAEGRSMAITEAFNLHLNRECDKRGARYLYCKKQGMIEPWRPHIHPDGVHLRGDAQQAKYLKSVRSKLIHHSNHLLGSRH